MNPARLRIRRQRRRARLLLSTTGLALTGLLAACTGGSSAVSATGASATSSLTNQTWLVPQDWGAIDPTQEAATNTGTILLVLEPLVLSDGKGGVTSNLATQSHPDDLTYVYTVRGGVKFSDGHPLTMADILYSFQINTAKDSKSNLAGDFAEVKSISVSGNRLIITMKQPDVLFPTYVSEVGIVEKSVREADGPNPGSPGHLNVGTGPYTVKTYEPGNEVVLVRNPSYWGQKPVAQTITLRLIQDDSARLLAVRGGTVTGAFEIPASEVPVYNSISGMKVIHGSNPSVVMLNVNTNQAPWNNQHVRQAASMAIDKSGIVKAVLDGNGEPAVSVVQQSGMETLLGKSAAASRYQKLDLYPYNVQAAKAELAKSPVPHGFHGTLLYSQAEETSGLVAQAVSQELKAIGIDLTVKSLPDSEYTDEVFFKHNAGPAIVDFTTDLPDPASLANYLTNSSNELANGGYTDIANWSTPANDTLLDKYLQLPETDTAQRGQLLVQILTNIAHDQPYIPIYNEDYLAVVQSDINFSGFDGMWWMRRWTNEISVG